MFTSSLDHRTAHSYSRRSQIAFVVLGIGAAALAAYALRTPQVAEQSPLQVPVSTGAKGGKSPSAPRSEHFDPSGTASRFSLVSNNFVPKPPVDVPPPDEGGQQAPAGTPTDTSIKFLGALIEPNRRVALMKINDHQHLMGPGDSINPGPGSTTGEITIVSVSDDSVEIKQGNGASQTITKAARASSSITFVNASTPTTAQPALDAGTIAGDNRPARPNRNPNRANRQADDLARKLRENAGERP